MLTVAVVVVALNLICVVVAERKLVAFFFQTSDRASMTMSIQL